MFKTIKLPIGQFPVGKVLVRAAMALAIVGFGSIAVNAGEVIDPTRPGSWRPAAAPVAPAPRARVAPAPLPPAQTLTLSGVMSGAAGSSALINGQWVGAGDKVADARVLSIQPGRVLLEQRSRQITLELASTMKTKRY